MALRTFTCTNPDCENRFAMDDTGLEDGDTVTCPRCDQEFDVDEDDDEDE